MAVEKPWEKAKAVGNLVRSIWLEVFKSYNLEISIAGLPALSSFTIKTENFLAYKTLITQEFLKRGYLAGTIFYASQAHSPDKFDEYTDILDKVCGIIQECEDGKDIQKFLDGPICHAGFKRLN